MACLEISTFSAFKKPSFFSVAACNNGQTSPLLLQQKKPNRIVAHAAATRASCRLISRIFFIFLSMVCSTLPPHCFIKVHVHQVKERKPPHLPG